MKLRNSQGSNVPNQSRPVAKGNTRKMRDKLLEYALSLRKQAKKLEAIADALEEEARASDQSAGEKPPRSEENLIDPELLSLASAPKGIFLYRDEYETCHIKIPNLTERLPAIAIENKFYSFARSFPNIKKALAAKAKLEWGGDRVVVTQTAKGYAIWVWEPEAQREQPPEPNTSILEEPRSLNSANPPPFNTSPLQFKSLGRNSHLRLLASRSELDSEAEATLAEYLSALNRLSELAHRYLGMRVVLHYWKTSRPEAEWLDKFEILSSGKMIFRGARDATLNSWEQEQLQHWARAFINRCRRIVNDFPQRFLGQETSDGLVAGLLLGRYETV